MHKMKHCLIDVKLALAIRDTMEAIGKRASEVESPFLCPKCHGFVKPNALGRFEHLRGQIPRSEDGAAEIK
jgi:hypothetical protein